MRDWYLVYSGEDCGAMWAFELEYYVRPSKDGSEWHVYKNAHEYGDEDDPEVDSELIATVKATEIRRYVKDEIGVELPDDKWREMGLSEADMTWSEEELSERAREDRIVDEAILAVGRGMAPSVSSEAIEVMWRRLGRFYGAIEPDFNRCAGTFAWPVSQPLEWDPEHSPDNLPKRSVSDERKEELLRGAVPTREELVVWRTITLRSWSYENKAWVADLWRYEAENGKFIILVEERTGLEGSFISTRQILRLFPTVKEAEAAIHEAHPDAHKIQSWPKTSPQS